MATAAFFPGYTMRQPVATAIYGGQFTPQRQVFVGSGAMFVHQDPMGHSFAIQTPAAANSVVSWSFEDAVPDPPAPKRNPNGYRQRKLKARLNQIPTSRWEKGGK
jgi:hypothetical protein